MADTKLNQFVSAGSAAARAAYTPTPPTPASGPTPGYFWHETDTGDTYSWKAGTGWIKVNTGAATSASTTEVLTGTDATKAVTADALAALWEQGSNVASAGTTSLGEGGYFNITGTTTITDIDFATDKAGRTAWVKFAGILTLTHNASTLILPTGANIATAAGDTACFVSEGSDVVRCVAYQRASGAALVSSGGSGLYGSVLSVVPTIASTGLSTTIGTSASVTDTAAGIYILGSGTNGAMAKKTSPGTPYTITALLAASLTGAGMLGWSDGTKYQVIYITKAGAISVQSNSTFSAFAAANASLAYSVVGSLVWLRIRDDGTNVTFYWSVDGVNFISAYTVAKASGYLGSSGYSSVVVGGLNGAIFGGTVMSWTETV